MATSHLPTSLCLCTLGYIIARGPKIVPLTGHNLVNGTFQLGLFLLLLPHGAWGLGRDPWGGPFPASLGFWFFNLHLSALQ